MRFAAVVACAAFMFLATATHAAEDFANETGSALELDVATLHSPGDFTIHLGDLSPFIHGRAFEAGLTDAPGGSIGTLIAQVGFGPYGTDPRNDKNWVWSSSPNIGVIDDMDEFAGQLAIAEFPGLYQYTYRYSTNYEFTWTLADLNGAGSAPGLDFSLGDMGVMTVTNPEPSSVALSTVALLIAGRNFKRYPFIESKNRSM